MTTCERKHGETVWRGWLAREARAAVARFSTTVVHESCGLVRFVVTLDEAA